MSSKHEKIGLQSNKSPIVIEIYSYVSEHMYASDVNWSDLKSQNSIFREAKARVWVARQGCGVYDGRYRDRRR